MESSALLYLNWFTILAEDKFYREGLANWTQQNFVDAGYDATFYQNLVEISHDETTHVNFLTGALNCRIIFNSGSTVLRYVQPSELQPSKNAPTPSTLEASKPSLQQHQSSRA